ncbi:unnamed protein product [Polarella glacialis]|uniref:GH15-like domain-containing protein n=1 Tax=Polarella glacialis TaxID=89957 RepID=A0A813FVG4_POLGL|nr:unnamed protein product [Polarella glacialis]
MGAARYLPHKRGMLWRLARLDLDWLAKEDGQSGTNVERSTCDLWEETTDSNFLWNRVVMHAALVEGAEFAAEELDSARAESYLRAANSYIGDPFSDHVSQYSFFSPRFLSECPVDGAGASCRSYKKTIDGAVILSLVHARVAPRKVATGLSFKPIVPMPTSELVAHTVKAYNELFCRLYPINREDSNSGVPGVLYGRYELDKYGSDGEGNPWVLISAALASLLYQAAQVVAGGSALSTSERAAWVEALRVPASFHKDFGSAEDFVSAGDSVLSRLRGHIVEADDMHLYEQIDRHTGKQYNAKDLTWSYGEVLNALAERGRVFSKLLDQIENLV